MRRYARRTHAPRSRPVVFSEACPFSGCPSAARAARGSRQWPRWTPRPIGAPNPAVRLAFSLVAFFLLPSSGRICFAAGSRIAAMRTSQLGSCQVGTLLADAPMRLLSTRAISRIDRKSPATARKRSPAAAGCVMARTCRSATSRTSTRPKEIRGQPGMAPSIRRCTIEDRRRIIGPQDRAEHAHRIDDGELQRSAIVGEEIPGRALGQGLRFHVGEDVVAIGVRPVRLIQRRFPWLPAIADRRER